MNKNIEVMIVDDHIALREGIKCILLKSGNIVIIGEAESGEQAYEMYSRILPEVLIMDMSMPGMGGIEALRRIVARKMHAKIIMYSMHDEVVHVRQALASGAMGYILKSSKVNELCEAVYQVSQNKHFLSNSIAQKLALGSMSGKDNPIDKLTAREYEVFCFLAEGMKVSEIASVLAISHKTVATYQTQLKQKLNVNNAIDLVRIALQSGIIS